MTAEFLSALAAIVLIDLTLAGDNAIVIALAARNLPIALQRKAVLWGTAGAVAVRAALTGAVLWLLEVPGLMLTGGVLLAWIAYELLVEDEADAKNEISPATGFWSALRAIVVADAVMGLDNVLAVAGAAGGEILLVVLGLVISVPIVVWGSTLILRFIERFPFILYAGGAALAWTSARMVTGEPFVKEHLAALPGTSALLHLVTIAGVLGLAWARNRAQSHAARKSRPLADAGGGGFLR